jgi:hypothetical protein
MQDSSSGEKLKIALFGDLSLEEAMDLSQDRRGRRRIKNPQDNNIF